MRFSILLLVLSMSVAAQEGTEAPKPAPVKARPPRIPKPGVPAVQKPMTQVRPEAEFSVPGVPDWLVETQDAVWVSNGPKDSVARMDIKKNEVVATVPVGKRPCSGLAAGFGSVWVPNCGDKTLSRVDVKTNKVTATIPVGPANSEGGLACSTDSVWMLTDPKGVLSRIDPDTNKVVAEVVVPPGSFSVAYGEKALWVTSTEKSVVSRVDPFSNIVTHTIEVGKAPRFITVGEGFVWTLNQGDGSVSKIDPKINKVVATIEVGIPGPGGEISAGAGSVWVTAFEIPISRIDVETNKVTHQYAGPGGDAIRYAHGSVWLSNLRQQNVWRIVPSTIGGKDPE